MKLGANTPIEVLRRRSSWDTSVIPTTVMGKTSKFERLALLCVAAALAPEIWANSVTATQTLNPQLAPIGKLSVVTTTVTLTHTGTTFSSFTGSDTINYKIRTTLSTGSGTMTVKATSDFSPTNGPRVANGDFTYTCGSPSLGTGCSGTQTLSTTSNTSVLSVGAGQCVGTGCSGTNPSSVTVNFTVTDNPTFKTGSYSSTLTFTISGL